MLGEETVLRADDFSLEISCQSRVILGESLIHSLALFWSDTQTQE